MEHVLANGSMRVGVRPDLGGRIDRITDLETGKEWLWHPAWYAGKRRALERGSSFDENWSGGWDEVFPNDAACQFQGRALHDHGELWSQPWRVLKSSARAVTMAYACSSVPVSVEKRVSLADGGLEVRYIMENGSADVLPFLFKLHPALSIEEGDEILLPRCRIEPVDAGFSTIIGRAATTAFPLAYARDGTEVVVNRVPGPEAGEQEFFYATELAETWCGLKNTRTGKTFTLAFDGGRIPYVWVFASYGKWRRHYVLVLEPCTNVPYDLAAACARGTCALLGPGERRETMVTARIERGGMGARAHDKKILSPHC